MSSVDYVAIDSEVYSFGLVVDDPMDPKDACKDGGFAGLGFRNQGQCIASIVANENAGKQFRLAVGTGQQGRCVSIPPASDCVWEI